MFLINIVNRRCDRERIEFCALKLALKSIYDDNFPDYLSLEFMNSTRTLRCSSGVFNLARDVNDTFHDTESELYNILMYSIKSLTNPKSYAVKLKQYLLGRLLATFLSKYWVNYEFQFCQTDIPIAHRLLLQTFCYTSLHSFVLIIMIIIVYSFIC